MANGRSLGITLIALLVLSAPALAQTTTYDVAYYVRVPLSQTTHFYGDGAYQFLGPGLGPGPTYISVYVHETTWQFIGMYGAPALGYPQATLPSTMPPIDFPAGTDVAVAVPVNISSGGSGGSTVSVPELGILRRLIPKRLGGPQVAALLYPHHS